MFIHGKICKESVRYKEFIDFPLQKRDTYLKCQLPPVFKHFNQSQRYSTRSGIKEIPKEYDLRHTKLSYSMSPMCLNFIFDSIVRSSPPSAKHT